MVVPVNALSVPALNATCFWKEFSPALYFFSSSVVSGVMSKPDLLIFLSATPPEGEGLHSSVADLLLPDPIPCDKENQRKRIRQELRTTTSAGGERNWPLVVVATVLVDFFFINLLS